MKKRLFIASNRLPVTINVNKAEIEIYPSAGGLVSSISGYLTNASEKGVNDFSETFWIGYPGCTAAIWEKAKSALPADGFNYLPVFIGRKTYEQYYNGFSNSLLWPLFHYFPSFVEYNKANYESYLEANRAFMASMLEYLQPGDTVWIHDYHLLPLPKMLRENVPNISIGFFLHIPFPSYEIFRVMPTLWQETIINGLLGADLIGFHTIDYAMHFLSSVQMTKGIYHEMHTLRHENRLLKIDVFPISIDYIKFHDAYDLPLVTQRRTSLKKQFGNKKIIFSVDRLDYTKGVQNRLRAYEYFLNENPQYIGEVVFILYIVPSRDSISKYAERKKLIDEFTGNLNSSIGRVDWQPIVYQYDNLEFEELIALYTCCDLALITPLRDGMNLVAKEFVASRKDQRGVLVLSEMAGAARELTDALTINPNDIEDIASKIKAGLEMGETEQAKCISNMQIRLRQYNVNAWADDFLTQLESTKEKQKAFEVKFIDDTTYMYLQQQYQQASKRLLLLDYDGTLIPFSPFPDMASPSADLQNLLALLANDDKNTVFVISGRDSRTLEKWLGHLPINIIAEHGAKIKTIGGVWKDEIESSSHWKPQVATIMELYVKRCVNSFIESKDFSVAWHYRNAHSEQGKLRATELYQQLEGYIKNLGLQVITGNKVIEVRNTGVNKGSATKKVLAQINYDFVLSLGDDTTDEDMFRELAHLSYAHTIKVGSQASYAKFNITSPESVQHFLRMLPQPHL